jgi:hypothetical protein
MVAYEEILPGSPDPDAPKEDWIDYLSEAHGDIEDGKATLLFLLEDREEDVRAEDIGAVTDEPPTATFT